VNHSSSMTPSSKITQSLTSFSTPAYAAISIRKERHAIRRRTCRTRDIRTSRS
jgi:hypothetical protein